MLFLRFNEILAISGAAKRLPLPNNPLRKSELETYSGFVAG